MIINFKKSGTLKIHLTITINFISSKNVDRRATIQNLCDIIMQMKLLMN